MSENVRIEVTWPEPHTHQFHVEATFEGSLADPLDLQMPAWNPGSYLIREFARHVSSVEATGADGEPLKVRKVSKDTWRIEAAADGVTVRYRVYANELTVRTCHLDDTHAFFNGVGMFLYNEQTRSWPVTLKLGVPEGWTVATGLEREGEHLYRAADFDELVDCPVEAGTHRTIPFTPNGVPHEIAIWGKGNFDVERMQKDLTAIVEESASMFGGLPYDRYVFITHLSETRGGGLEHRNSSVLNFNQLGFHPEKKYAGFLELAAHELFHVWNVKRIKPDVFTPYDYNRENYTRLLWVMEGITDYYAFLLCARAGVTELKHVLELLGQRITRLQRTPGRKTQSLEDSSHDTWVKLYRPDENSVNSTVSYYLKGSLVAAVLDLEIRARSGGEASLDDVMRALFQMAQAGQSLGETAFGAVVKEATGVDVSDLLEAYVSGTEDVSFPAHLAHVGLAARSRTASGSGDKGGKPGGKERAPQAWLGATLRRDGRGRLKVSSVPEGTPALRDGLYAGDEVLAVDGWRVADARSLDHLLEERAPGERVDLTVFRRDRLCTLGVTLGERPRYLVGRDRPGSRAGAATAFRVVDRPVVSGKQGRLDSCPKRRRRTKATPLSSTSSPHKEPRPGIKSPSIQRSSTCGSWPTGSR